LPIGLSHGLGDGNVVSLGVEIPDKLLALADEVVD
jgi:hypothetical protein